MTEYEIADAIRAAFPDATSVTIFVNAHEAEIKAAFYDGKGDRSMKTLSGKWCGHGIAPTTEGDRHG